MPWVNRPRVGVVGFDFGTKRAYSLALPPRNYPIQQQVDEETQLFCHDAMGDTLESVTSGVTICSGCYTIAGVGDVKVSFIGTVNGVAFPAWDGSKWVVAVDTITVEVYASSDGTCTGLVETDTGTLFLTVVCSGAGSLVVNIVATVTLFGITPLGFTVFANNIGTPFGTTITNTLGSGDCGNGTDPIVSGYDGNMTLAIFP